MPRLLIKLPTEKSDCFLGWSTVVDAPVTDGLSLEELRMYVEGHYGADGLCELDDLERIDVARKSLVGLKPIQPRSLARSELLQIMSNNNMGELSMSAGLALPLR